MRAYLKNFKQSPRKVRLTADLIRGKRLKEIERILMFSTNKAAPMFKKLIDSAISNTKDVPKEKLELDTVMVDEGLFLRRILPKSRGRTGRILKRSSNVLVTLKEIS